MEPQEDLVPTAIVEPPSALRWRTMLAVPFAAGLALAVHAFIAKREPSLETHSYRLLFIEVIAVSILLALLRRFSPGLRHWMANMWPIFTLAIVLVCVWDIITLGFRMLPLPYFPGPSAVLRSLINDRVLLLDSTWHSLVLLLSGYTLGVIGGLISGICIGWSSPIRYWGMPLLKVVGPIPATAWIPLAMVLSPSAIISSAALIALAVWFPVTMLTSSGISNTRASYLDVARTLGDSSGRSKYFHRFVYGIGCLVSDVGRRRIRRREVGAGMVRELGARLGRIREGLRRAHHHGGILFNDHDGSL